MQPQRFNKTSKVLKEAFFVQVPAPDGTVAFHNATAYLGKQMPFNKPKATCAMRVTSEAISFSLLHLTKKSATKIADEPVDMPRGPLAELARKSVQYADLELGQVIVEHKTDERNEDGSSVKETYKLKLEIDDNGVANLESEEADHVFELPRGAVRLGIYLKSPAVDRVLSISFIGHLGKPGDPTSIPRVTSMVLFSLSQLVEFRVLSKIETVKVPSGPHKYVKPVRRASSDKPAVLIPVNFYAPNDEDVMISMGSGELGVEVDLENANPTTGRLLFNYTPSAELEEHFGQFRDFIDHTVSTLVTRALGLEEIAGITYDIVLGDVDSGTVERLKEALDTLQPGMDFSPNQYRAHVSS